MRFQLLLLSTAGLGLVASAGRGPAADAEALSRAAILAYKKNVDAFPSYSCKYQYFKATSKSLEAALAGNLQDKLTRDAVLVVDHPTGRERFEILTKLPPADKLGKPVVDRSGKTATRDLPYMPSSLVTLNGKSFFYCPPMGLADIREKWDEGFPKPMSLIFMGNFGYQTPYSLYKDVDSGITKLTSKGSLTDQGRPVIGVTLYQAPPCTVDNDYFLDPQRGYLPVRILHRRRPPYPRTFDMHNHVLEAKEFSGNRWFPMKVLNVDIDPSVPGVSVRGLEVLELTVDEPFAKDAFTITVPAGTRIQSEIGAPGTPSAFRLRQDETVRPEDIPRIEQMLTAVETTPLMDTAITPPRGPLYLRWWFLTCVAAVAVAGVGFAWRHRARVRRSPHTQLA